jgi:SRSO17 transposase
LRKRCAIPRRERSLDLTFKSKSELALDSIHHLRSLGVHFSWIGVDGGYGKEPHFLSTLDDLGELFVADLHKDQRIYLEDPAPHIPERKTGKGRTPSKHKTDVADIEVQAWAGVQPKDAWRRITTRHTTKGRLEVDTGRDVGGTSGFHAGATFFVERFF